MVNLTIDDKNITVPEGTSIMEAARKNGIDIPGFCYHPRLDSFGACRICMVHVTERGKTSDRFACAQPVSEGMIVKTKSEKIERYIRSVTEYLLAHHPLDCPICDKAGECELQDVSYNFRLFKGRFQSKRKNRPVVRDNPFIEFNHNRCILCGRCTRICDEVEGIAAIAFQKRGFNTEVGPAIGKPLRCEFCGQCLSVCPVGAIQDRIFDFSARPWELKKVRTTCTYCSVGCTLSLNTKKNMVARITSNDEDGINEGNLCVKGRFGFQFIQSKDRLTSPLIKKDGRLTPATWEEALEVVCNKFRDFRRQNGPNSIGGIGSEKSCNEDNYLFQKFFRGVLGSNNIDNISNIRAPYLNKYLLEAVSFDICSSSLEEVKDADLVFLLGTDVVEEYPVAGNMIRKAVRKNGASLIIANVRNIDFKGIAQTDLRLRYRYGREVSLINGILKLMIDENIGDIGRVKCCSANFSELKEYLDSFYLEEFINASGVSRDQLYPVAKCLSRANNSFIFIGKEILAGPCSEDILKSVFNLAIFIKGLRKDDSDEKRSTNIFFPREHNNSQGVNDMGVVPDFLPGYQEISDEEVRQRFKQGWSKTVSFGKESLGGFSSSERVNIFEEAIQGRLKALYIMAENPLISHIDGREVREALNNVEFIVVQDSFLTETGFMADVVLPSATFAEREGTFTNLGRLVQKVNKAIDPLGSARPDWQIICDLANRMGHNFNYSRPEEIIEEIAGFVPIYSNVKYNDLKVRGAKWPVNGNIKQCSLPAFKIIKGQLPLNDDKDKLFPFTLITGGVMFHLGTYSHKSKAINEIFPDCIVEINPSDAEAINVKDGDTVEVVSTNNELRLRCKVTKRSPEGIIFIPSSFENIPVNLLIDKKDNITRAKVLKVVA